MRVLFVLALLALAGCETETYGVSWKYRPDADAPMDVDMPPGAPGISQQFYRNGALAEEVHNGIDIKARRGTPVIAAADGVVLASFWEPLYGNRVRIDHGTDAAGQRHVTQYFHLQSRTVSKGQRVARGEAIGAMGSSGVLGAAVHLHFEVWQGPDLAGLKPRDPHRFWAGGPGRVTCFDPARDRGAGFVTTYPVGCR